MARIKTSGQSSMGEAYGALQEALRTTTPSCAGDSRFTSDTSDPAPLKVICQGCPVLEPCRTLALSNPAGRVFGILGGRVCRAEPKPRRSEYIR